MARAPLLQLSSISLTFGGNPLFDGLDLTVQPGDRVALVGRNGSGKSTLMKIMAGLVEADSGSRVVPPGTTVGYMEQDPDLSAFETLGDYAASGLPEDESYKVSVVAEGLKNGDGLLAVTLYADDSSKFLVKRGSLYVGRVNAQAGTTRACIFVPRPGVYALALYHDENGNRSFDRTGVGFPAEGFGFSNNPATLAGLPTFKSVRLNVPKAGLTTRIQMKYP